MNKTNNCLQLKDVHELYRATVIEIYKSPDRVIPSGFLLW